MDPQIVSLARSNIIPPHLPINVSMQTARISNAAAAAVATTVENAKKMRDRRRAGGEGRGCFYDGHSQRSGLSERGQEA